MKCVLHLLMIGLIISIIGCEKVSKDAVKMTVDYTWAGMKPCQWGNPEINVSGVPEKTKFLKISMYDHAYRYNHGKVLVPYTGNEKFEMNRFKELQGPCPPAGPGRYEITIKAIDENDVVIGIGSKERMYPEKE